MNKKLIACTLILFCFLTLKGQWNGNNLDVTGYANISNGILNSDNYFEKIFSSVFEFSNSTPNLAADIRFGNLSIWGYIEVEVNSTYNYQNSTGKLTKVFAVGTNPGNLIYTNESRVTDAIGTIPDNISIGEFSWDDANSTYRIPISHITSTQNRYTLKIRVFTDGGSAKVAFDNMSVSGIYSLTSLPKNHVSFNGNVGIGTKNPQQKLDVNGTIRANEVVVNTSGADFVFDPEYKLPELSDIEKYVKENKHLPDILPATEMQKDGMNMSEMQTKLLQKIEELTLYIIEQQKEIEILKDKVMDLENPIYKD